MDYIKHFNSLSSEYKLYRPEYPLALYEFLIQLVITRNFAWDCGTGTGQSAFVLASYFKQVIATDINLAPLESAKRIANIDYRCSPAEKTEIPSHTVDLITVAQALHWFNLEAFYQEVMRVSKSNAIIAAWCYSLGVINPSVDLVLKKLYDEILGDKFWPSERRFIDEAYETIYFPFPKVSSPQFFAQKSYFFKDFIGYLNTWSAVKEYQKQYHTNPIDLVIYDFKKAWGDLNAPHLMTWPIHLLIGKISEARI